ncbi:MAG: FeoB-associated Cys-rich membrane protein [Clostridia bacterium]|nr:FeoB-associated Cys-rich membrane protein [Clostridia bacterium]
MEIIVIIACVLIVGGVIVRSIINKKKGKTSCGCDCSSCSGSCSCCSKERTNKENKK